MGINTNYKANSYDNYIGSSFMEFPTSKWKINSVPYSPFYFQTILIALGIKTSWMNGKSSPPFSCPQIKKSEGNFFYFHYSEIYTHAHPQNYFQAVADIQLFNWHYQDSHLFYMYLIKVSHYYYYILILEIYCIFISYLYLYGYILIYLNNLEFFTSWPFWRIHISK